MDANFASETQWQIGEILRLRRSRSDQLGSGLFSDPAWDILLQLFAAKLRGHKLRLAEVAADVPSSTLARWATLLQERGLISCAADAVTPSILWIALSPSGAAKMSKLFATRHPKHRVA